MSALGDLTDPHLLEERGGPFGAAWVYMSKYLVRVSKSGLSAHVWTGEDTACKMWSSGGLLSKGVRLSSTQMGRRLCKICAQESGEVDNPGVAPEENINALLRGLEVPSGGGSTPKQKPKKKRNQGSQVKPQLPQKIRVSQSAAYVRGIDVRADDFLQTYEWRRVRMEALKMYGARCQCCGASPADGAVMNVDHIKPRKLFPHLALSLDNLQILCHECNHGKGNWDMTDWRTPEVGIDDLDEDAKAHLRSI